jgi:hypothetical protein
MLIVLLCMAPISAPAATAESVSSLSDHELVTIRDSYLARKQSMLSQLAGKPFVPAAIRPPLKRGRGRYARHYGYSVTNFAMNAF